MTILLLSLVLAMMAYLIWKVVPEFRNNLKEDMDKYATQASELKNAITMGLTTNVDKTQEKLDAIRNVVDTKMASALEANTQLIKTTLESVQNVQTTTLSDMGKQLGEVKRATQEAINSFQTKLDTNLAESRGSLSSNLKTNTDAVQGTLDRLKGELKNELQQLLASNQKTMGDLQKSVEEKFTAMQKSNEERLEKMRQTVDEKLQGTLEKRLGESFRTVSEQLEKVHSGLGEMKNLATDVGGLKRVLSNVKARGVLGEIQLENILEQILAKGQYDKNVQVKSDSAERVEYAVILPGSDSNKVVLPIDAKFPRESYERLLNAFDKGDVAEIEEEKKKLLSAVKKSAKDIHDKYINPPTTTDFALLFLPIEGLYAEVLRYPDIMEELQRQYHVILSGPTTLIAILNSFRMGFKTMAIEQRASEVWQILEAVKTEFQKFGGVLDKVKKQLATATKTIDETSTRTRVMERKLKQVEQLPEAEAAKVLELASIPEELEPAVENMAPETTPDDDMPF